MRQDPDAVEVIVKLDPLREPITGRVTGAGGQDRHFSGWLDLMDILDEARSSRKPPTTAAGEEP